MNCFIFHKEKMEFRYSSGTTMYTEALLDGRKFTVSGYTLYSDGLPVVLDSALTSRMLLIEAKI